MNLKTRDILFFPSHARSFHSYIRYMFSLQAYYFDRSDVALTGLYKYFKKASDEEREHAMKFLTYQNKRGGDIVLTDIQAPARRDWNNAKDAMTEALQLEKKVNQVRARCVIRAQSISSRIASKGKKSNI